MADDIQLSVEVLRALDKVKRSVHTNVGSWQHQPRVFLIDPDTGCTETLESYLQYTFKLESQNIRLTYNVIDHVRSIIRANATLQMQQADQWSDMEIARHDS